MRNSRPCSDNNRSRGFYGAFSIGYSEIDDNQAVSFGGRFEWIVGHSIGFGFGGTGFINEYHWDDPTFREMYFLQEVTADFILNLFFCRNFLYTFHFHVLLGVGGISYISKEANDYHNMIEDSEVFLIAEPAAELEFNLTRNFRFAIGASYRFTTPLM